MDWNSPVKEGQLIAQIDPAIYKANLVQAEGQLANAKANYELTRVTTERTRELYRKRTSSPSPILIPPKHQLLQARAQVKIQTASVDLAKVNLEHCDILSPIDGVVVSRQVDVGNTVAASLSAPHPLHDRKRPDENADHRRGGGGRHRQHQGWPRQ